MLIPAEALVLENRSIGVNGEPTLAAAYAILKSRWDAGDRDRELALHLFFLSWYCLVEPAHLTGVAEPTNFSESLNKTLSEAHDYLDPASSSDAETLYVTGLAAHLFWFMFANGEIWERRANDYRTRYRELAPAGIDLAIFRDRGAYGDYYGHQAAVKDGY
jgi:hypothetical protein